MLTHGRAPLPPLLLLLYPREARARRSRLPPTRLQAAASFVRCTSGAAASAPQRQHSRGRRRGLACRGPSPCPGCGPPRQAPAPAHSRAAAGGGKRRLQGSGPAGQEHQAVRAGEAGWQAGLHCAAHRSVPGAGGPAQHLQLAGIKPGGLVHVLEKPPRGADQDVHACGHNERAAQKKADRPQHQPSQTKGFAPLRRPAELLR